MHTMTLNSHPADQDKASNTHCENIEATLPLLDKYKEEAPREGHSWLDKQFTRAPFRFYQLWIVTTFIIIPAAEFFIVDSFLESFENYIMNTSENFAVGCAVISMSFVFLLFGCAGMLRAIWRKKSSAAQEGFIKFQYSMIGSLLSSLLIFNGSFQTFSHYPGAEIFVLLALLVLPIVHLIGGFYVLRMFRKNHPLARQEASEEIDQISKEFFEQNGAIRSEILKFDEQLETWPFFIYKVWLKFFVMIEIMRIGICVIYEGAFIKQNDEIKWPSELVQMILFSFSSFLGVWSSFKVELVLMTKKLNESKRVISLLAVSIGVSATISALALLQTFLNIMNVLVWVPILYGLWLAYGVFANSVTLFGAIKIKRIIEQRNHLIKYSNYVNDSYL